MDASTGSTVKDYTWQQGRQLQKLEQDNRTFTYTYDANGMRTSRSEGAATCYYIYNGDQLTQMRVVNYEGQANEIVEYIDLSYDASGTPFTLTYTRSGSTLNGTYYYITNIQGDVIGLTDSQGNMVIGYQYDAYGVPSPKSYQTEKAELLVRVNPLLYRSYVYDLGPKLYYLQSRYYDPELGRFINADDPAYLGADGSLTGYNLFAYCGNNPVMGYDPTGCWDWGGVIAGLGIIAGTVISIATFGIGSPIGALIAGAAIATGAITTYAAATDSAMVVDLSYSKQVSSKYYVKGGGSIVVDFKNDNAHFYPHLGGGKGYSNGLSYSSGIVENYEDPNDYAKHFIDLNVGYYAGLDHCWNPLENYDSATKATSITFSKGGSYGVGYDYYFGPKKMFAW